MTNHELAQHIAHQINASGGAQPSEDTLSLCEAVDPDVSDVVVQIVASHRNSDGTIRPIVDPADAGAKAKATASLREAR